MIDFKALLYDPLYAELGVDAVISTAMADAINMRVIDRTDGVEIGSGDPRDMSGRAVLSVRPVAAIRVSDLACTSIKRTDLDGATITFNGKKWIIKATLPKPSPTGEDSGELYLVLIEGDQ